MTTGKLGGAFMAGTLAAFSEYLLVARPGILSLRSPRVNLNDSRLNAGKSLLRRSSRPWWKSTLRAMRRFVTIGTTSNLP